MSFKSATSARSEVLAAWRRVDATSAQLASRPAARPASELMPVVLERLGLERKRSETEILKVWNHLMDPEVAAHAQPVGLAKGTLFVRVDSHVWKDEIVRYRRREILKRLQHSFGMDLIVRISFTVG